MQDVVDDTGRGRCSGPSLAELKALHAVFTTGKTTTAAQRLGVSQPAVSRAITALEARLGCELFVRDSARLIPTSQASALAAEAASILEVLDRIGNWPDRNREGAALRVMVSPTLASLIGAPVLSRFMSARPATRVVVDVGTSADAVSAVVEGSIDVGIVDTPQAPTGVRVKVLCRTDAQVLLPKDHPLAARNVLTPDDLADQPLIAMAQQPPIRDRLERVFAACGRRADIVAEAGTIELGMEMVKVGLGLAFINPFPAVAGLLQRFSLRAFEPGVTHEVCFIYPETGSDPHLARGFADLLRESCA